MSFAMGDRPYDESRLGTANSFQGQASLSGLSSISGLSSLTLVDSTANLQKPASFFELDDDTPKPRSKLRLYTILFALYLSLFLAALDQSIVATAVPTIASDLKSSQGYVWVGSAYLLAMAAGGPIWSNLSDIFGRKIVLLTAVLMFFGSSIACAAAQTIAVLIFGRVVQGLAGGGLFLLVNILISDLFSVRERSLYLGLLEVVWAIAGGVGPILGGTFTELASWRWCFWINLPLSGLTFLILLVFLDVHNPKTPFMSGLKAIDWLGSFFILAFTVMFLVGIELGGVTFPWTSPVVICLIIFGILMLPLFVMSEKRAKYPLIPLDLLENWSNVASLLVGLFHGMVYIAQEFYLPLYFQSALSASPIRSGLLTIPILLSQALMGIVCGILIHRTGRYLEITYFGCVLMAVGIGLYTTFSASSSIPYIIGMEIIAGIGAGCLFEPPLIALYAFVSKERTASATSTLGFIRCIGQALSLVLGGVVFQNSMNLQIPKLITQGISSSITDNFAGGHAAASVMVVSAISDPTQRMAVKDAFVWSLRNMWILYTCLSGLACIASVFIGKRKLDTEHVETKTGLS